MSLNHRDGGSGSRSCSRKNRKLGERVIQREEPVSGYREQQPRDPRDRSEEPGSQEASGSAMPGRTGSGPGTACGTRRLGSSSRGPALGRG